MLINISVPDIDISAKGVKGVFCSSINRVDVYIPANIAGYDIKILYVNYVSKLVSMKEVGKLQRCSLMANTNSSTFDMLKLHRPPSFLLLE